MILQKFALIPQSKETMQLYLKADPKISVSKGKIELKPNAKLNLETYFNLFSCQKWKKYVGVETVYLRMRIHGNVKVKIDHLQIREGIIKRHSLLNEKMASDGTNYLVTEEISVPEEGMLGVSIEAVEGTVLLTADFSTEQKNLEENDVNIGIG